MKLNEDKCYLLVEEYKHESIWTKIGDAKIWEPNKQKLLKVHIDETLFFDDHFSNLCKEAGTKLSALARLSSYMTLTQRRVLMKFFIEDQEKNQSLTRALTKIILSAFTTETFKVWLSNYIEK